MGDVVIIGYGNSLRGDDAVGHRAADFLQGLKFDGTQIEITSTTELAPEVAERLSRADLAIFIDATVEGEPGNVCVTRLEPGDDSKGPSTHDIGVGALLGVAKLLFGSCPEAALVTVTGSEFEMSTELSPKVEAALPEVRERVCELIQRYAQPGAGVC